jgi:hypothetical protein
MSHLDITHVAATKSAVMLCVGAVVKSSPSFQLAVLGQVAPAKISAVVWRNGLDAEFSYFKQGSRIPLKLADYPQGAGFGKICRVGLLPPLSP